MTLREIAARLEKIEALGDMLYAVCVDCDSEVDVETDARDDAIEQLRLDMERALLLEGRP
jgi:hypothetical protein